MAQLYLVRHGQACFGADNYDQLSPLVYQQARWLGEYFAQRNIYFDRIICGDMVRQRQTVESIINAGEQSAAIETHSGFNEFDFTTLLKIYNQLHSDLGEIKNKQDLFQQLRLQLF